MSGYLPRIVDRDLDALLPSLAAIALEGPKAVGKTATAVRRATTVHRLDLPATRAIALADPSVLLRDRPPVLLDEWQHAPSVWDAVRHAVDADPSPGRFLLTGSATAGSLPKHSGAGRIVRLRMRPLSLAERGLGEATVSLARLLAEPGAPVAGQTTTGLADYTREIVISGFPAIRQLRGRALRAQLDGYLGRVVDRDFSEQGHEVRRPELLQRWMAAYAAATSTTTEWTKIREAAASGEDGVPAKTTVHAYREVLERLWLLEQVPGWIPSRNQLARLTQAPRHHLVDAALAARLLGVDEGALLRGIPAGGDRLTIRPIDSPPRDGTLLGQLFESLVTQSVLVYAQAAEARVRHLRTYQGEHEVDLIVETDDQRIVALEVKLSPEVTNSDVKHLLWLREQLDGDSTELVVVTTGTHAYRRPDGVAVVPASLLGP
jgi:predicted AAA+ superfamily ATPase